MIAFNAVPVAAVTAPSAPRQPSYEDSRGARESELEPSFATASMGKNSTYQYIYSRNMNSHRHGPSLFRFSRLHNSLATYSAARVTSSRDVAHHVSCPRPSVPSATQPTSEPRTNLNPPQSHGHIPISRQHLPPSRYRFQYILCPRQPQLHKLRTFTTCFRSFRSRSPLCKLSLRLRCSSSLG